jgi:membrane-associated phospholipid phosphatase
VLALTINNQGSFFLPLLAAVFIALFVGVIRWLLGAHTIGQIMLGYTIGILMQLAAHFFVNS